MFSIETLFRELTRLTTHQQFCIAYSGGLDSHVLLHAMALLQRKNPHIQIRAVHINHGWSALALQWEAHVIRVCSDLSVPLTVHRLTLTIAPGDSVEAIMREARYAAFEEILIKDESLITAHTEDDQAETFLLQLLRGAGIKGLSAMPDKKKFGVGFLLRPLLNVSRGALREFAEAEKLHWIEDESNDDHRFNRNYLRQKIIPLLRVRWPHMSRLIARSAAHCVDAQSLLDELADQDLIGIQQEDALIIPSLLSLTSARRNNVLRRWIQNQGLRVPHKKHWEQIYRDVLLASPDAHPIFSWRGGEIRRRRNLLFLCFAQSKFALAIKGENVDSPP